MILEYDQRIPEFVFSAFEFAKSKLMPRVRKLHINVEMVTNIQATGDVMYEDDREFTVRLRRGVKKEEMIKTILHEMVHVKQYVDCMVMDTESDYWDRWQEIEAHRLEAELYEQYQ